jgi:hypothetical protein
MANVDGIHHFAREGGMQDAHTAAAREKRIGGTDGEERLRIHTLKVGTAEVLTKPFDVGALREPAAALKS